MSKSRTTRMLSGSTVQVELDKPFNPTELKKQLNYVVDYRTQQKVVPNGFVTGLWDPDLKVRATNTNGKPFALLDQPIGDGVNDKGSF